MDQTTNELRQDIDATRDSMTDKLAQIEDRVKGTVDDLKGTVTDTVDQVKQAFDLKQQVNDRPWTMLGASVLAGYVLGSMGGDDYSSSSQRSSSNNSYTQKRAYYTQSDVPTSSSTSSTAGEQLSSTVYPSAYKESQSSQPGFMSDIMDQFGDEIETLKGAAIATVTNMLRDMLKQNLPKFAEEFERARSERDQKLQSGEVTNSSYEPLGSDIGTDRDATYQTHTTPPVYNANPTTNNSYTAGSTGTDTTRNSL